MVNVISVGTFSKEEAKEIIKHQEKMKANLCYCHNCNKKVVVDGDVLKEDDLCPNCNSPLMDGIINML